MAPKQPSVHWTWWPSHISFLPDNLPAVLPPPVTEASIRAPFGIHPTIYNAALRPEIPISFALIYMITVLYTNAHNRRTSHAPWGISKTAAFGYFVVAHNVLLALYSLATFLAMGRAVTVALPSWSADNWSAKTADALCKLHGPRGFGDAATFNASINIWEAKNTAIKLAPNGIPDPTDVGRLWNEGLAFWGWWFYISKFYEVLDTFIVLAKGKRSATLQTYHHAGAMLCMWAGIRYMSPPIWMFVFVNSGIHALMYTYFTLSALNYRVPRDLKRVLTALQITQFVWGASYAAAHLFIQYDMPTATPFQIIQAIQRAVSSAQSAAGSATSAVSSFIDNPTLSVAMGAYVKKLLLRAAGEQGVAERVALGQSALGSLHPKFPAIPSPPKVEEKVQLFIEERYETRYRHDWSRINCIDTTGEAFAIYLNLIYLSPLTWLFVRFFMRAYSQRSRVRSASQALHEAALAARETRDSFERDSEKIEREITERSEHYEEEVRNDVQRVVEELRSGTGLKAGAEKAGETVKGVVEQIKESASSTFSSSETSSSEQKQPTWISGGGGLFRRDWTGNGDEPEKNGVQDDSDAMGKSGEVVQAEDT